MTETRRRILNSFDDPEGSLVTIREATGSDAAAMVDVMQALLEETPFMLRLPEEQRDVPADEQRYIRAMRASGNSIILLAEVDDRAAGVVVVTGGGLLRLAHVGYLGMGVLRRYWGRGVGPALLDVTIAWARAHPLIRRINLQVYATNERAIRLYQARGFLEEGRLRGEVFVEGEYVDMVQMGLTFV